ncbi:MAG: cytochrome c biogenesis protein CcsA [Saprospirales bacterium]|nr:cytochrome c biogenesis protein CcsA [Saprospirales bacterium]
MEYIGEHLLPGKLGHFFVVFSFVAALLACVSYFLATRRRELPEYAGWRNLGRFAFLLHGMATLGVIGTLFYILVRKYYEYQYAWANVSDDLPFQYTFSAFWKEQQGSFLLWSFWHIVLGVALILRAGRWEAPVLTLLALAEVFIASMILGLYFGDFRFGASPFDLLRQTMDAPVFAQADYLTQIKGNGLNPLLQNYWMTIHPPTLFLGFASTIVPFSYAVAGLWLREHKDWLKPALSWSLFSGAILGTGILMGGAWAYEALSFGGYWAWDPVENSSLVPWITLVAGIHTNLIARNTGYSIRSTYAFYLITFILVLYSTYLTRSGILGDTSAHAFTEMGLGIQLVLFMAVFSLLGLVLWFSRWKSVPDAGKEEGGASREFWMFIGALVLFFSAVLITGATSLPVWNKLMQWINPDYVGAALKDPVEHHNRYQLWIAVFIGALTGIAQWLRYGERNERVWMKNFVRQVLIAAGAGIALSALNAWWLNIHAWQYYALLFAAMFTLSANLNYIITFIKGNLQLAGSAFSHIGFGALVLGILGTGLNKAWISSNAFAMEGLIEGLGNDDLNKNILLLKEAPMPMQGNFEATYLKDTVERQTRTFSVRFKKRDAQGAYTDETFVLQPNVMYNRQFTEVVASNPSTKHYLTHDIFTHVSSLPKAELDPEFARAQEDSLRFEPYEAAVGDTIFTRKHYLVLDGYTKQPAHPEYKPEKGDLAFGLNLRAYALEDTLGYPAAPMLYIRPRQGGFTLPAGVGQLQLRIRLTEASMRQWLAMEEELPYQNVPMKEGQTVDFQGYKIRFAKANRDIRHPNYAPEPNDIAVAADLEISAPDGRTAKASPVYLIRANQPFSLKDEAALFGLHFRFENIDPQKGILTIAMAQASMDQRKIPLEIAANAPRSDYIVLEAIVFPGINLVWAGSILMLFGLALSMWRRLREKRVAPGL